MRALSEVPDNAEQASEAENAKAEMEKSGTSLKSGAIAVATAVRSAMQ